MNLIPYVSFWAVLVFGVVALALYRKMVASHEDLSLHIAANQAPLIAKQTEVYKKIETIDRWGQILTVVAVLYGLVLGVVYLAHMWQEGSKVHWG